MTLEKNDSSNNRLSRNLTRGVQDCTNDSHISIPVMKRPELEKYKTSEKAVEVMVAALKPIFSVDDLIPQHT